MRDMQGPFTVHIQQKLVLENLRNYSASKHRIKRKLYHHSILGFIRDTKKTT